MHPRGLRDPHCLHRPPPPERIQGLSKTARPPQSKGEPIPHPTPCRRPLPCPDSVSPGRRLRQWLQAQSGLSRQQESRPKKRSLPQIAPAPATIRARKEGFRPPQCALELRVSSLVRPLHAGSRKNGGSGALHSRMVFIEYLHAR